MSAAVIEEAIKDAFETARLRACSARDNLARAFQDKGAPKDEEDAYSMALDELDKIAFAMKTMRDIPRARDKSRFDKKKS